MANASVSTESLAIKSKSAAKKGPKLKIAIIGCGGISGTHMAAYQKMDNVEIVAGVDILPERLENMKEVGGQEVV